MGRQFGWNRPRPDEDGFRAGGRGAFDDDELRAITPPTLEDIGRLWTFIRDARSYLKEAAGYLDDLEKDQLEDIDYVRVLLGRDRFSEGELRKGDDEAKQ